MQAIQVVENTPKLSQNINFVTASAYDVSDLRDKIKSGERFVVRQGDLIIMNYSIIYPRRHGLRYAHIETRNINGRLIDVFRDSHYILSTEEFTSIYHPEHGLVVIPTKGQRLSYYTIDGAVD